jgi:phenylalanyl-tRNA synthetase beta chain
MRVPMSWLREYVAVPETATAEQVAADLVRVGLEEEAIHGGEVTGPLVVGRVLDFTEEPQKNGKTIRWCSVDVGAHNVRVGTGTGTDPGTGTGAGDAAGRPRGIVCGARNFAVGDLVAVSLPGAVLPGGFVISARKTYGHVSDGMICSARELGLGEDHAGILRLAELGVDVEPGTDALPLLGLAERTVEVNVTPDRGYAFSVRGVAREYGHATGAAFTDPVDPDGPPPPAPTADGFAVRLDDGAPIHGVLGCDRYTARVVRGVDAARPSPAWLQRRLEQAGMRPISLAVDVTNYVMLGVGQPLHAFDLDTLTGPIVVRRALPGERLTTLDDVDRALDPEDLLITDDGGRRVLALAGVMGGASSEVSATTRNLLVESAHFDPVSVARASRRHKLSTEASRRYERGVDRDLAARAADLAVRLLVEYGGGEPAGVTDTDLRGPVPPITMSVDLPARIVGVPYTAEQVTGTLTEIGCRVEPSGDGVLTVHPPTWRPDLRIGADLAEEVARLRGYQDIPSVVPVAPAGRGLTHGQRARRSVARALAEHGLVEVLSYPFVSPLVHDAFGLAADDPRRTALRLANPLSDEQPELRTSLLPPLLETLRRNVGRGQTDLGLFEIGLVVNPSGNATAPRPGVAGRPSAEELAALHGAVPDQPRHVAVVLAGQRVPAGWYGPGRAADWTDAVDAATRVVRTVGLVADVAADERAPWHPGRCARIEVDGRAVGHAGELHPKVVAALGLPDRTVAAEVDLDLLTALSGGVRRAVPVPTFPVAKEDVALVVDAAVPSTAVEAALRDGAGELLESVRLFDVYTGPQVGEGRKSLAYALRLRAADRTLTAQESAEARDEAVAVAADRVGAVLRGV